MFDPCASPNRHALRDDGVNDRRRWVDVIRLDRTRLEIRVVHVGVDVGVRSPSIDPVALSRHRIQLSATDHLGEHDSLDRQLLVSGHEIERARFEHVRPGARVTARRLARRRLLDESFDLATLIDLDDSELAWILDRRERDRPHTPARSMECNKFGNVEITHHVAVGDDERVVDPRLARSEPNCTGGVERRRLDRIRHRHPTARVVGERRVERLWLEAEREHDVRDSPVAKLAHETFHHRHVCDRQQRLRRGVRDRSQSRAEPSDEHDRVHRGLLRGLCLREECHRVDRHRHFGAVRNEGQNDRHAIAREFHTIECGDRLLRVRCIGTVVPREHLDRGISIATLRVCFAQRLAARNRSWQHDLVISDLDAIEIEDRTELRVALTGEDLRHPADDTVVEDADRRISGHRSERIRWIDRADVDTERSEIEERITLVDAECGRVLLLCRLGSIHRWLALARVRDEHRAEKAHDEDDSREDRAALEADLLALAALGEAGDFLCGR